MGKYSFSIILLSLVCLSVMANKDYLYDLTNSGVMNLNAKNFNNQITLNRNKNVISIVHYYKLDDGKSSQLKANFEKFAVDYDGMFKVTAINCKNFMDICEKNEVKTFPTFKVYPPIPAPVMDYDGPIESVKLMNFMGKFVNNKVQELNNNSIDSFISERPNLPKCILFTDKAGTPLIFKSLAVSFDKKIEFGIVRSSDTGITSKYRVNSFPKIMVLEVGAKKPKFYEGETKFNPIFQFLNVFSETFFRVGEDKARPSDSSKADKPWLSEKLPELNKDSGNDICFKIDGVICVVLANNEKPNDTLSNLMSEIQNYLTPKIDRGGIKYKFSWLNVPGQPKISELFGLSQVPRVLLINPGKRKRYFVMEEEINESNLRKLFEKLSGGDLRFKMIKGNNIPDLE